MVHLLGEHGAAELKDRKGLAFREPELPKSGMDLLIKLEKLAPSA